MIHKTTRALSAFVAAALAFGTFQLSAHAGRTIMASAARATQPADHGCFYLSFGSMTNGCGAAKRLEASLPVDYAGWYTVKVNASGASPSNNVGCEAVAVNAGITAAWSYGQAWLPAFGTGQTISTTTWLPAFGGLYVYCDVLPNGHVNTIGY
jgi:hypothetical protein